MSRTRLELAGVNGQQKMSDRLLASSTMKHDYLAARVTTYHDHEACEITQPVALPLLKTLAEVDGLVPSEKGHSHTPNRVWEFVKQLRKAAKQKSMAVGSKGVRASSGAAQKEWVPSAIKKRGKTGRQSVERRRSRTHLISEVVDGALETAEALLVHRMVYLARSEGPRYCGTHHERIAVESSTNHRN